MEEVKKQLEELNKLNTKELIKAIEDMHERDYENLSEIEFLTRTIKEKIKHVIQL